MAETKPKRKRKRKVRSDKGVKRPPPAPSAVDRIKNMETAGTLTDAVIDKALDTFTPRRRVGMYEVGESPVECDRCLKPLDADGPAEFCGSTNSRVLGEYYTRDMEGNRFHHRRRRCQDCRLIWVTKTATEDEDGAS